MSIPRILWLDLETSGLDHEQDVILEVAACLAAPNDPFDVMPVIDTPIQQKMKGLRMDDFVWKMHTDNGLLEAIQGPKAMPLQQAEDILLAVVPEIEDKEERYILGGASIHFDMRFLRRHMRRLWERLSYRLYDVSTVKLFLRSLGMPKPEKADAHRAMADIRESIQQAEACAHWMSDWTYPEES